MVDNDALLGRLGDTLLMIMMIMIILLVHKYPLIHILSTFFMRP